MKTYFYSEIVETTSLSLALAEMDLTNEERKHLIDLVQENLHHAILDSVLSELSEEEKQKFLKHLANDEDKEIWDLLNSRVDNIEDKIKKTADDLKNELHSDIKTSHIKSNKA